MYSIEELTQSRSMKKIEFSPIVPQLSSLILDELVHLLLGDLVRFQERTKQRDASNFRRKRRYVCGIKETLKQLSLETLKGIVVATDAFSNGDFFTDYFREYKSLLCESKEIPIIYALNRRSLTNVMKRQRTGLLGIVGIISYDGIDACFKRIVTMSTSLRQEWEIMALQHPDIFSFLAALDNVALLKTLLGLGSLGECTLIDLPFDPFQYPLQFGIKHAVQLNPFLVSVAYSSVNVAHELWKYSTDVSQNPICLVLLHGNVEILKWLISISVPLPPFIVHSFLHVNYLECFECIHPSRTALVERDIHGDTPLHVCLRNSNLLSRLHCYLKICGTNQVDFKQLYTSKNNEGKDALDLIGDCWGAFSILLSYMQKDNESLLKSYFEENDVLSRCSMNVFKGIVSAGYRRTHIKLYRDIIEEKDSKGRCCLWKLLEQRLVDKATLLFNEKAFPAPFSFQDNDGNNVREMLVGEEILLKLCTKIANI